MITVPEDLEVIEISNLDFVFNVVKDCIVIVKKTCMDDCFGVFNYWNNALLKIKMEKLNPETGETELLQDWCVLENGDSVLFNHQEKGEIFTDLPVKITLLDVYPNESRNSEEYGTIQINPWSLK